MTPHPHQLYAVPFTQEADQARLVGFSCGAEVWARHVTEWLLGSDVFDSMKKGTRVWLFETATREVVGFGSIGTTRWRWPLPDGSYSRIVYLPMLGVAEAFRGQPPDPEWRYARQIVGHLVAEAERLGAERPDQPQWLVLLVHGDNSRAIRFYETCGFELIPGVVRNGGHVVMKTWIGGHS